MSEKVFINNDWQFYTTEDFANFQSVRIPHTCKELPLNYFSESEYQMLCFYKKTFIPSLEWQNKIVELTFEGVAQRAKVFLNGIQIAEHHCGYTAFSVELSEYLKFGEQNEICVHVDSRGNQNQPPFGNVVDYLTFGGIYRDVYFTVKNKVSFKDIFLHSIIDFSNDKSAKSTLCSKIEFNNKKPNLTVKQFLTECNTNSIVEIANFITQNTNQIEELKIPVNVKLWSTEMPNLYEVKTQLFDGEALLDEQTILFGFRQAVFKKDGFYLNNKKLKIRGLNRHQSFPYVGYAMPKSMQIMDANILKKELGLNAVRTSHYPQSHYFIEECDKLGLLVFTEIPGWQFIGDEEWKTQAIANTKAMIEQYRNHTSIVLWGVRINESDDCDEFYARTNKVAHETDPFRQTGGVRKDKKSSLLEDVYTYNDFVHSGKNVGCEPKAKITSNKNAPYLISEYNGHMFPTKAFDCEAHRTEHALRHAKVLDSVAGYSDIAGSFGWCFADYNTHKDFGSGDRICYHGVLDSFRNPKLAASVYACQQSKNPVLELNTTMDIGEHAAIIFGDNWIFTNADSVKMYKNGAFIKEYTAKDSPYKNLVAGPILLTDYIGDTLQQNEKYSPSVAKKLAKVLNAYGRYGFANLPISTYLQAAYAMVFGGVKMTDFYKLYGKYIGSWGDSSLEYKFEAIKDGKTVKTVVKKPMTKCFLKASVSSTELTEENTYDVAAIRICVVDENENLLNFANMPLSFATSGQIELIGPKSTCVQGGLGGTYVKTVGKSGIGTLIISCPNCAPVEIQFSASVKNGKNCDVDTMRVKFTKSFG